MIGYIFWNLTFPIIGILLSLLAIGYHHHMTNTDAERPDEIIVVLALTHTKQE